MSKEILLFTYGTLKRGFLNNSKYLFNSEFIGTGKIKGELFVTNRGMPICIDGKEDIQGEIFLVPEEDFEYIRSLELRAYYYEDLVNVNLGEKQLECIVYKYDRRDLGLYGENLKKIEDYSIELHEDILEGRFKIQGSNLLGE